MADKRTEDLIRKMRALKAKAEDPSVTEAEAAAFAAKVAEMLAEHGLVEAQLAEPEQESMTGEKFEHEWTSAARRLLAVEVCKLYMVRPIVAGNKPWLLVGRPHNILLAKEMTAYLIATVTRLSNEWKRNNKAAPNSDRYDYRRGMYERLSERLKEMRLAKARAAEPVYSAKGNPGNLPALIRNERLLAGIWLQQHGYRLTKVQMNAGRVMAAGQQGRQAADGIGLGPQLKAGGAKPLMIGRR